MVWFLAADVGKDAVALQVGLQAERLGGHADESFVAGVRLHPKEGDEPGNQDDQHFAHMVDGQLILVVPGEVLNCCLAEVVGYGFGDLVHESRVEPSVAGVNHLLSERAVVGDDRPGHMYDGLQCSLDVAGCPHPVPFLHPGQDLVDGLVHHGLGQRLLVGEVVVEEGSGHPHLLGDVLDGDVGESLIPADIDHSLDDFVAFSGPLVRASRCES